MYTLIKLNSKKPLFELTFPLLNSFNHRNRVLLFHIHWNISRKNSSKSLHLLFESLSHSISPIKTSVFSIFESFSLHFPQSKPPPIHSFHILSKTQYKLNKTQKKH